MNCHGFPKACDNKYLFDHRLDRFDHPLSFPPMTEAVAQGATKGFYFYGRI
jgi:hypothetical protein